jgi:hypothetical protein
MEADGLPLPAATEACGEEVGRKETEDEARKEEDEAESERRSDEAMEATGIAAALLRWGRTEKGEMGLPAAAASSISLSTPVRPHAQRHEPRVHKNSLGASFTASFYLSAQVSTPFTFRIRVFLRKNTCFIEEQ